MPKNENEWFVFTIGAACAALFFLVVLIGSGKILYGEDLVRHEGTKVYCSQAFGDTEFTVFEDGTWSCE